MKLNFTPTLLISLFFTATSIMAQNVGDLHLYIGTYTRKTSEGLYVYRFNSKTGEFSPINIEKNIVNPSFLTLSPDKRFLFSMQGEKGDSVCSFSIDKTNGNLNRLNSQPTTGIGGAHIQTDKTGKWLIVGNYRSGSLCVLPIKNDGSLDKVSQKIQHQGKSVNPERQTQAYVHSINIAENNKDVFVPDLGLDKIMTYTLNAETGHLSEGNPPFTTIAPGSGPRHFTFHPNGKFAYSIQEMGSTVTGFKYTTGKLETIQTISSVPDDYKGLKWSADIHVSPDGKFLYASNRAHESLAIYKINSKSGLLNLVGFQNVGGKTPRNFAIEPTGNYLLVANQDSDNVTIFKRNKRTGALTTTGKEIKISMPVCLVFN